MHLDNAGIINLHLLAIPVYDRHTGLVIFEVASKALDVLCPSWRDIIIGVSTDGERKMTGRVSGAATRFQNISKAGFIKIWCGAHQLDLVLQDAYCHFGNELFYGNLTASIGYLRRQQNLVKDMRSQAPKVADTRWESMSQVSSWFKLHRIAINNYFQVKTPSCTPPPCWWVQLMIINHFAARAPITFKQLQGHRVTVCQQRACLLSLKTFYLSTVNGKGPLEEFESNQLDSDDQWLLSSCRRYAGSHEKSRNFLLNQGSFVLAKMEQMSEVHIDSLVKEVTKLYVEAAARISRIVAERDANNESTDELPAVLPNELVRLEHSLFCTNVQQHRERLLVRWTDTEIDIIEQEHQELVAAYHNEAPLQSALNACDEKTTFDEAWSIVKGRFKYLLRFCGGVASVFPGTSQVESDFSIVKGEKTMFKKALVDLSLEGILHAKQFDELKGL